MLMIDRDVFDHLVTVNNFCHQSFCASRAFSIVIQKVFCASPFDLGIILAHLIFCFTIVIAFTIQSTKALSVQFNSSKCCVFWKLSNFSVNEASNKFGKMLTNGMFGWVLWSEYLIRTVEIKEITCNSVRKQYLNL